MFAASKSGSADSKDAQFKNVTMLLHGNGTNGAQNNTFLDSSTNNFTITRNGNTTQGTFTPYGSNWSNYFSATGSYLSVPYSSDFNLTGDFTIQFWMNPTNLPTSTGSAAQSYCRVFSFGTYNAANSLGLEINSNDSGNIRKLISWYNGTSYSLSSNNAVTTNIWQHIALVRSGTTITCYINGTSTGSTITSASAAVNTSQSFYIATLQSYEADSSAQYAGYLSNFSILKGTAKYTSNFTPTTSPLSTSATNQTLLTCTSNRFFDANTTTTAKTITATGSPSVQRFSPFSPTTAYSTSVIGGSGYFDGSGDYLTVPNNVAFDFGSGSFTLEAMIFPLTTTPSSTIFGKRASGAVYGPFNFGFGGSLNPGYLTSFDGSNWGINISSSVACNANAWNHIAVTRNGSTFTIWVNGVSGGTASNASAVMTNTTAVSIGATAADGTSPFNGYIADARIVKGTAVYTTAFTPPTAPLTAITNTSLLLSYTNAGILDNAMMNDLETVGNAQISTSVKKYGTGSMYFDGSGDYLKPNVATPDLYAFGSGDFTIEFWGYILQTTPEQMFIDWRPAGTQTTQPLIYVTSAGVLAYYVNAANRITGATLSTSTWYHIAVSRSGTSTKMFLNGTQTGSTWTDTTVYTNVAGRPVIGLDGNTTNSGYLNGYIDDLRITKGVARYTANFSVPTAAFPDKG